MAVRVKVDRDHFPIVESNCAINWVSTKNRADTCREGDQADGCRVQKYLDLDDTDRIAIINQTARKKNNENR